LKAGLTLDFRAHFIVPGHFPGDGCNKADPHFLNRKNRIRIELKAKSGNAYGIRIGPSLYCRPHPSEGEENLCFRIPISREKAVQPEDFQIQTDISGHRPDHDSFL
jgi:hypothetical protein